MIRILCIATLLTLAGPSLLGAQEEDEFCPEGRTQLDMNNCAAAELARVDTVLNLRYQEALRTLEPHRVEALRVAQRAWIAFRDAECEFQASEVEGGSMHPMVYTLCLAHHTRLRIEDLEVVLNPEGVELDDEPS